MKWWKFGKKVHIQEDEPDELDKLLYKYMPKYEEQLMAELERNVDYEYEFSENYRKKMERLIRKERHIVPKRILKRVAMGIVAFVMTFCISMYWGVVTGNAQWTKLYETIKTIWEDFFLFSYFDKSDEKVWIVYEPEYMLEGYELVRESQNECMKTFIYKKGDLQIKLQQRDVTTGSEFFVDSAFVKEEVIKNHGMEIFVYYYETGEICTYYEYLGSVFIINTHKMNADLNREEIIKIYEGWIK